MLTKANRRSHLGTATCRRSKKRRPNESVIRKSAVRVRKSASGEGKRSLQFLRQKAISARVVHETPSGRSQFIMSTPQDNSVAFPAPPQPLSSNAARSAAVSDVSNLRALSLDPMRDSRLSGVLRALVQQFR